MSGAGHFAVTLLAPLPLVNDAVGGVGGDARDRRRGRGVWITHSGGVLVSGDDRIHATFLAPLPSIIVVEVVSAATASKSTLS